MNNQKVIEEKVPFNRKQPLVKPKLRDGQPSVSGGEGKKKAQETSASMGLLICHINVVS